MLTNRLGVEEAFIKTGLSERNKVVFDFVFQYYYSSLCAFAESILKDEEAVEDIVQDLFVRLWLKADEIKIQGAIKNYLFSSVRNRCFDYLKHKKVKARSAQILLHTSEGEDITPETWLAESELREVIERSIETLAPRCQEVFRLSRFEGLKNQEIADKLGISKRTVELQISNALKVLRTDMKPYLPLFLLAVL